MKFQLIIYLRKRKEIGRESAAAPESIVPIYAKRRTRRSSPRSRAGAIPATHGGLGDGDAILIDGGKRGPPPRCANPGSGTHGVAGARGDRRRWVPIIGDESLRLQRVMYEHCVPASTWPAALHQLHKLLHPLSLCAFSSVSLFLNFYIEMVIYHELTVMPLPATLSIISFVFFKKKQEKHYIKHDVYTWVNTLIQKLLKL